MFTRTDSGLAEKWRFCEELIVWVEGPTDVLFYRIMAGNVGNVVCRFEAFGGRATGFKLIGELKNKDYPYVVILDGDYDILGGTRAPHGSVLIVPRYSVENLLWERDAVNEVCCRYAQCGEKKDLVGEEMATVERVIEKELLGAIVLDVAARRLRCAPKVLPDRVEAILKDKRELAVDREKVANIVETAKGWVDKDGLKEAERKVMGFLEGRSVAHLFKGHLLFGLLRRIVVGAAARERGKRTTVRDEDLAHLLAAAVWTLCRGGDHGRMKRMFRTKVRVAEVRRRRCVELA